MIPLSVTACGVENNAGTQCDVMLTALMPDGRIMVNWGGPNGFAEWLDVPPIPDPEPEPPPAPWWRLPKEVHPDKRFRQGELADGRLGWGTPENPCVDDDPLPF